MDITELAPGVRILYAETPVTILREGEPARDILGQPLTKFYARREDTKAEGYLMFGSTAVIDPLLCACGHTVDSHVPGECVGCTGPECQEEN